MRPPELKSLQPEQYSTDEAAHQTADELDRLYSSHQPEAVRMLTAILRGSPMGPESGWFGPAESCFDWEWLARAHAIDPAAAGIGRGHFRGPERGWNCLDRDGDGLITRADLDWSERSPWVQQAGVLNRVFRRLNAAGNGRLQRNELQAFFDQVSGGTEQVTIDQFRQALLPPKGFLPGDAPSREMLVQGLFSGELGSVHEGPHVGDAAPDFSLESPDGKTKQQLSTIVGDRPVVLVFGNFTCSPFRAYFPEVENVYRRWSDSAHFLMVYVREAHPVDGWKMESNTRCRVSLKQPTTLTERIAACEQFRERLLPTVPVVVDQIPDLVGHLYSGMPARLYVIDKEGLVAYKSGRGPFGFRVGEMEQALAMSLLV